MYTYNKDLDMIVLNNWGTVLPPSGTSYKIEQYEPKFDLSMVVCDYCGNRYFAKAVLQLGKCSGCGAAKFHFER